MSVATLPTQRVPDYFHTQRKDYPDSPTYGARAFTYETLLLPIAANDDLMAALSAYSMRAKEEYGIFEFENDEVTFGLFAESPGTSEVESDDALSISPPLSAGLDEAQSIVRDFGRLVDGWDEPGSCAPSREIIDDALVVLQNWQPGRFVPEPEASFDGKIALELYDSQGFTLGGIELIGNHRAVYSVNWRTEVLDKGSFDTTSQSQIISALSRFKALEDKEQSGESRS